MNKIIEALKKLIPDDQVNEVASAVEEMLDEARADLDKEFETKLEDAYKQLSSELMESESTTEKGYDQAFTIIQDLRTRLETQREEFESALEEGYEEAYQMLQKEKGKNDDLEVGIYEEYDKKLQEMKNYMVDKIDQFLSYTGDQMYEQAKREILNDPRMVEHKVALDRIIDVTANYLSDEDYAVATSSKLEEANRQSEELKGRLKILESKNTRLSMQNHKLNEQVKEASGLLTEYAKAEKKERVERTANASGRGQTTVDSGEVQVLSEFTAPTKTQEDTQELPNVINEWKHLAGLKKED